MKEEKIIEGVEPLFRIRWKIGEKLPVGSTNIDEEKVIRVMIATVKCLNKPWNDKYLDSWSEPKCSSDDEKRELSLLLPIMRFYLKEKGFSKDEKYKSWAKEFFEYQMMFKRTEKLVILKNKLNVENELFDFRGIAKEFDHSTVRFKRGENGLAISTMISNLGQRGSAILEQLLNYIIFSDMTTQSYQQWKPKHNILFPFIYDLLDNGYCEKLWNKIISLGQLEYDDYHQVSRFKPNSFDSFDDDVKNIILLGRKKLENYKTT